MKGKGSKSALVEALESRRLLSAFLSLGQPSAITRNPPVPLTGTPNPQAHEFEMATAVNPANPMDVAVFTTVLDYARLPLNDLYLRLYWSTNGGATWQTAQNFYDAVGDPGIAYAADGNLFISYISNSNVLDQYGDSYKQVTVRESTDFGSHSSFEVQTSLFPPDITDGNPVTADRDYLATGPVY